MGSVRIIRLALAFKYVLKKPPERYTGEQDGQGLNEEERQTRGWGSRSAHSNKARQTVANFILNKGNRKHEGIGDKVSVSVTSL